MAGTLVQAGRQPELTGPPQSYFSEACSCHLYHGTISWLSQGTTPPHPPASRMACSGATCKGAYSLVRKEPLSKITSNLNAPSCRWREERASRAPLTSHSEVRNVTGESKEDTEPKRTPRVWWATWIFISSLGAPGKWGSWSSYCSRGDRAERLPATVSPTSDGREHHWGGHGAGHGEQG